MEYLQLKKLVTEIRMKIEDLIIFEHENSERDGNTRPSYLPPENLYAGQEATVRTGHGKTD